MQVDISRDSPGEAERPAKVLTNNQKDRQHHQLATYGNYRNYYFHRAAAVPDARLVLLPTDLFLGKSVLDLGCNAGKLTIETCSHLGASKALGIDLDDVLIQRAKKYAVEICAKSSNADGRCRFVCDDFMKDAYWDTFVSREGRYDTILLLSITKWLHLHHGDAGLLGLFRDLLEVILPGGTLVVEPQEWQNYKRAVSKNTTLRPVFKALKLRPNFTAELENVGFVLRETIEREEGGFSRPLMLWTKPINEPTKTSSS